MSHEMEMEDYLVDMRRKVAIVEEQNQALREQNSSYSAEDAMAASIVRLQCETDELRATVAMLQEQARILAGMRDLARAELEMWRDGNIMHEIHRDELEKVERERDEARAALERITESDMRWSKKIARDALEDAK